MYRAVGNFGYNRPYGVVLFVILDIMCLLYRAVCNCGWPWLYFIGLCVIMFCYVRLHITRDDSGFIVSDCLYHYALAL